MGAYQFKLPDIGEGTAEAEIVNWHVKVGDTIKEDQPLVDMMTDKATVELTSPVGGIVQSLAGKVGEKAAVGSVLVTLEVEGAGSAPAAAPKQAPPAAPVAPAAPAAAAPKAAAAAAGTYEFKLPDIGEGTAEAEIVNWHVKVGDTIKEDQPLVDMMTDKATVELTSPVGGVVQSLGGKAGEKAAVGSVLVTLAVEGGAAQPVAPKSAPVAAAPAAKAPAPAKAAEPAKAAPAATPGKLTVPNARPAASPSVRKRAFELGAELRNVPGTGPQGRITHADLERFMAGGLAPAATSASVPRGGVEEVPVIGMRRQIAERMQLAKRHIPHFTYVEEVDMTAVDELRVYLNANKKADQPKLTVLPFFMLAMAKAIQEFPQVNALYDDEAGIVRRYAGVHIGMAAQTAKGLMVPVVRHVESLTVWELAKEISRLAVAARDGKAKRDELTGSTITLSSLGILGGVTATPVINRPEVAIICPNKIIERPAVRGDQIVLRKMMNLSSSYDHRIVDGVDAAAFVQRLKDLLENPATIFI